MIGKSILHYKILEKLGEGGMGIVYLAEDSKLKRQVAIKFLPGHIAANSDERKRFEIEAQAAAALNHQHITTIYAIEESSEQIFLVMEYIEGKELKEVVRARQVLPKKEAIEYILQIIEGLQAAHKKGIVHRDIKSANIMVTTDGKIKIMDFGLAKFRGSVQLTQLGTTVGTAAYMSPEQAKGEDVDQRADIWSVGVVFSEMLNGELPFKGEYEQAIIYAILNEKPHFSKSVSPELKAILLKMLAKNPSQRYQKIDDVLQDIKNINSIEKKDTQKSAGNAMAVLPFENISPDNDTDYFADGLAEELIVNLTRIKDLRVVPRTTSMRYKDSSKDIKTIASELNVSFVMTGSVRKFQDNLRISVQLINTQKDTQQWAETYKGKLEDVFDIQENVSKEIVDALKIELTPSQKKELEKRSTVNPEAFDLYLRAKGFLYRMTKNDIKIAIDLFQKAVKIDPNYASAYAGLSEAYGDLFHHFEKLHVLLQQAIDTAQKALSIDPILSDAHSALAQAYLHSDLNEKAFESGKKAIEIDPGSFAGHWILGRIYFSNKKYEQAVDLYQRAMELNPDFFTAYSDLRMCYQKLGLKDKINAINQKSLDFYPGYLARHPDDARAHLFYAFDLSFVQRYTEAKKEAAIALELNPNDSLMQYNAACFYSSMGEKKYAIDVLKKAIEAGWEAYDWLKHDPDLDNIRDEPEFLEILKGK